MGFEKELFAVLEKHVPRRVLIQAPEGLKTMMQEIAKPIQRRGIETIIWMEPCFGACDIPDSAAKAFGCDLIIHIGHAPADVKSEVPVAYIEYPLSADFGKILEKNFGALSKYKSIGIVASVQYVREIGKAKAFLESRGKNVFVGKSGFLKHPGQVLGCDAGAAESVEKDVDAFVFLGSGRFHALGVLKKTSKPVIIADTESGALTDITSEKTLLEKKRAILNSKFREAKTAGILVSSKKGQFAGKDLFALKKKIEALGKSADIIAADCISPEKILGMKFDILVNTACPRIEDDLVFKEPIINAEEIEERA